MFIDLKTVTHMFLYAAAIASLPLSGAVRPIYVQAKFIPKIKIPAYPFARKSQNFGFAEHFRENGSNFLMPLSTIMSKPRLGCNNHICLADNIAPVKAMEHCSSIRKHEGIGFRQGDERNICKCFLI